MPTWAMEDDIQSATSSSVLSRGASSSAPHQLHGKRPRSQDMNENLGQTPKQRVKQDNGSKINAAAPQRHFLNLPEDILWQSFEWLDFQGTTRMGSVSKRLFDLSKNARVYRHLCELSGITPVLSLTSYRETFLRNYLISPALVLAVSQYRLFAFPSAREREREKAKVDMESILPRIKDPKMRVQLYLHIHFYRINRVTVNDCLIEYNKLLALPLTHSALTRHEADFYRATMRVEQLVSAEILSDLDAYNLFLSSRPHLSPQDQVMADFYRATMRVCNLVPAEILSDLDAYNLFLSSRPHLSPQKQAVADFYRAKMRAYMFVSAETLSNLDAYNLLLSSRPHLCPEEQAMVCYCRAVMRIRGLVPAEILSYLDAYNLLLSSRPRLSPRNQAMVDFFRAMLRVNNAIPAEILSNLDAYILLLSSRPHLSPVTQQTADQLVARLQSTQR